MCAVEVMQKLETDRLPKEMDSLEATFRRLLVLLEQASDYVNGVVVGAYSRFFRTL